MKTIKFTHELIKGKIAEMIFEQMLRDAGGFTILGFGYEKVVPELAHMKKSKEAQKTLEVVRRAPDFAIINHETNKVHLIEVKYRSRLSALEVKRTAGKMKESWNPSYLFIATPKGFYFDSVEAVIEKEGKIDPLNHPKLSQRLQDGYLKLLNEFITQKTKK